MTYVYKIENIFNINSEKGRIKIFIFHLQLDEHNDKFGERRGNNCIQVYE